VAPILHRALKLAARVITTMPAHYTTYANGETVFHAKPTSRATTLPTVISVDYLSSFGAFRIPQPLWLAFQRFNVWIDPTLTSEWARMMMGYAKQQGRTLGLADIHLALEWSDPARDVVAARQRAVELIQSSQSIHCVWTGKKITLDRLDMDHCIPWSAWPCGDLWNLMPADRQVNQTMKREKLPSAERIHQAKDRILEWWELGYESVDSLKSRFWQEADTTLPGANNSTTDLIDAIQLQRMRIHRVQLPREW
jgi:hypothetical protein